jgi:hypothetical protein
VAVGLAAMLAAAARNPAVKRAAAKAAQQAADRAARGVVEAVAKRGYLPKPKSAVRATKGRKRAR